MSGTDAFVTVIVITLIILLLLAGVIITIVLANRRHAKQEVKFAQIQLAYEQELRQVENEVKEEALDNISRELHDNIGQLLTLTRIQLEQQKLEMPQISEKLDPIDQTLMDTIDQVRLLSHSLNTDYLEQHGILYSIEKETDRLRKLNKFNIQWEKRTSEPDLSKDQRIMLFRVFQEIVNNILKHSGAKNIFVSFDNGPVKLTIQDDGVGFDLAETLRTGEGAGMLNILKRAKLANFILNIEATKGKGSIFTLTEQSSPI